MKAKNVGIYIIGIAYWIIILFGVIIGIYKIINKIGDWFVNLWIILWSLSMIVIWYRLERK